MRFIQERKCRETGTTIEVWDARDDGEGWETICQEHATVCSHDTRALAISFAPVPTEWCELCMEQAFDV